MLYREKWFGTIFMNDDIVLSYNSHSHYNDIGFIFQVIVTSISPAIAAASRRAHVSCGVTSWQNGQSNRKSIELHLG